MSDIIRFRPKSNANEPISLENYPNIQQKQPLKRPNTLYIVPDIDLLSGKSQLQQLSQKNQAKKEWNNEFNKELQSNRAAKTQPNFFIPPTPREIFQDTHLDEDVA